jgi:hypothetical protein
MPYFKRTTGQNIISVKNLKKHECKNKSIEERHEKSFSCFVKSYIDFSSFSTYYELLDG